MTELGDVSFVNLHEVVLLIVVIVVIVAGTGAETTQDLAKCYAVTRVSCSLYQLLAKVGDGGYVY